MKINSGLRAGEVQGSFRDSCINIKEGDGTKVSADCRKRNYGMVKSEINIFNSDIPYTRLNNCNGTLSACGLVTI